MATYTCYVGAVTPVDYGDNGNINLTAYAVLMDETDKGVLPDGAVVALMSLSTNEPLEVTDDRSDIERKVVAQVPSYHTTIDFDVDEVVYKFV